MLMGEVATVVYWAYTPLGIRNSCFKQEVGIQIGYWIYSNGLIGGIGFVLVLSAAYLSFLLEINELGPLILK
jgi:hypothetical protein